MEFKIRGIRWLTHLLHPQQVVEFNTALNMQFKDDPGRLRFSSSTKTQQSTQIHAAQGARSQFKLQLTKLQHNS